MPIRACTWRSRPKKIEIDPSLTDGGADGTYQQAFLARRKLFGRVLPAEFDFSAPDTSSPYNLQSGLSGLTELWYLGSPNYSNSASFSYGLKTTRIIDWGKERRSPAYFGYYYAPRVTSAPPLPYRANAGYDGIFARLSKWDHAHIATILAYMESPDNEILSMGSAFFRASGGAVSDTTSPFPSLANLKFPKVINASSMCSRSSINHAVNWTFPEATFLSSMFAGCTELNHPVTIYAPKCTGLNAMFSASTTNSSFNNTLSIYAPLCSDFSTMFQGLNTTSLNPFNQDLTGLVTSSATTLSSMFRLSAFNHPSIASWDVSNVTVFSTVFWYALNFNQDISSWNTGKATNMSLMFAGSSVYPTVFNQPINSWNVSNVTNFNSMFEGNTSFNQPLSNWDVKKVTNFAAMFSGASAFNQDLGMWQFGLTGLNLSLMLDNCGMSTENYSRTIIGWANYVYANAAYPRNLSLGAIGRTYHATSYGTGHFTDAVAARAYLTTATGSGGAGWTISGDALV